MTPVRRILCPVDFSAASRRAAAHALALARGRGAVVSFVSVLPAPVLVAAGVGTGGSGPEARAEEQRRLELRRFVRPERHPELPLELRVEYGTVPEEIANQALATRADLVVVDGHGWPLPDASEGRELAAALLDRAAVPVLVVSPLSRRYPQDGGFRRIVCAVDLSPASGPSLDLAAALAAADPPAELALLHVLEGFPPHEVAAAEAGSDLGLYWRYRESHAREGLGELAAMHARCCRAELMVSTGQPWLEILDVAGEKDADLIVVGSRRFGDPRARGATASRLVPQAACPVLIVPRA
jgi:universal stress protein A